MDKRFNFTPLETATLLSIVEKYGDIINCKKTNCVSNENKKKAWLKIAQEFNAVSGMYKRTAQQLKDKYKNFKKLSQLHKSADREKSGGGTAQLISSDIEQNVQEPGSVRKSSDRAQDSNFKYQEITSTNQETIIIPLVECSGENGKKMEVIVPDIDEITPVETVPVKVENSTPPTSPPVKKRVLKRKPDASEDAIEQISVGARQRRNILDAEHEINMKIKNEMHRALMEQLELKRKRKEEIHKLTLKNIEREEKRKELEHELRLEALKSEINANKAKALYYEHLTKR